MRRLLYILLLFPFLSKAQTIGITTASDTICSGTSTVFVATISGMSSPHYQWKINALNYGTDTSAFVTSALVDGDTVKCLLVNNARDTIFAVSDSIIMTVQNPPNAGVITGSDSVCVGDTIFLSDNIPGGVWSASNTLASILNGSVTGLSSQTSEYGPILYPFDTMRYIVSNSCGIDTTIKRIVINDLPDASFGFLSSLFCVGSSYGFFGGDFDDPSPIDGDFYSPDTTIIVSSYDATAVSPGGATIYHVASNNCGTSAFHTWVTIYPMATASNIITADSSVCIGSSIVLSDSSYSEAAFYWSTTNGNTSGSIGSPGYGPVTFAVTGVRTGLDTVKLMVVEAGGQCGFAYASTVITVLPPDSISTPGKVCSGDSLALSDKDLGGQWRNYNPAITTINENTGKLDALTVGTDTIYYSLSNGCTVKSLVKVLQIPSAISGDDITCTGSSISLADTGNGVWSCSGNAVATIEYDGRLFGKNVGYDTVFFTYSNGCASTKQVRVVDCNEEANLFPNPVTDELIIEANTNQFTGCTISNCLGQVMVRIPVTQPLTEINTERWPKGVYFVSLWNGNSKETHKVVKE